MVDRPKNSSTTGTLQRAGIACRSCRHRKVKCDAQSVSPDEACSPCRRAGQECLLDPLSDGRRSVNRKYVDVLQQRIENLEALNQRNQRPDDGSAWKSNEGGAVNSPEAPYSLSVSTTRSPDKINTEPSRSNVVTTTEPAPPKMPSTSQQSLTASTSSFFRGKSPENSNTSGGSPSFFGATSHPHVVSPGADSGFVSSDEVDAVDIELDPASPHLRDDLFYSFFKYQSLWVEIVNKENFLAHQARGNPSRWYSKFLENSILACSARLSTSKAVRALCSRYSDWAKEEALSAMSEPTPAAMQGFLLLSEYEVSQGNDRPGWMFCGVACRMLSDLGLHELAGNTGTPERTKESAKESDLAYALLSACVVYEGVWTLYLGRPSSIPKSVMSVAFSRCKAGRESDSPWLNAWVGLCVPMAEISHVLNDQSIGDFEDKSTLLRKLFKQVEDWYERLPPELKYHESRLTNMDLAGYGLHTQYCKVHILLRRALAKNQNTRKRRFSQTTSDWESRASSDDSDIIIYRYAVRVARLFVTYREAFGVEKMPSIMLDNAVVAATAMMAHLNNSGSVDVVQPETLWLRQLVRGMETVQPHFPVVGRMLAHLKHNCGSGPLCDILPSASRSSAIAPTHELPAASQSKQLNSRSNDIREDSGIVGSGRDLAWDNFDMGIDSSMFFAGGLDNFAFDFPSSETSISGIAQTGSRRQDVIF